VSALDEAIALHAARCREVADLELVLLPALDAEVEQARARLHAAEERVRLAEHLAAFGVGRGARA
jgi:hypothetical protein